MRTGSNLQLIQTYKKILYLIKSNESHWSNYDNESSEFEWYQRRDNLYKNRLNQIEIEYKENYNKDIKEMI